jgi:hypothetical protein
MDSAVQAVFGRRNSVTDIDGPPTLKNGWNSGTVEPKNVLEHQGHSTTIFELARRAQCCGRAPSTRDNLPLPMMCLGRAGRRSWRGAPRTQILHLKWMEFLGQ